MSDPVSRAARDLDVDRHIHLSRSPRRSRPLGSRSFSTGRYLTSGPSSSFSENNSLSVIATSGRSRSGRDQPSRPHESILAVASSMLIAAYHMLKHDLDSRDLGAGHFDRRD